MYAVIIEGVVVELRETDTIGPAESAIIVECGNEVQVGWRLEAGAFVPPPEPDPNAKILTQIDELEALQTPRLLREAMKKKACVVNKPGTIVHGLSPSAAIDALDATLEDLRGQLSGTVYYQPAKG